MQKRKSIHSLWCAFLFAWLLALPGIIHAQEKKISISFARQPLPQALSQLQQQTGTILAYDEQQLRNITTPAQKFNDVTLYAVLNTLLKETGYGYSVVEGRIIISKKQATATPAKGKVTGRILDEDNGEALYGVTVQIGGQAAVSDVKGEFTFSLPEGAYQATFSSVGYEKKQLTDIQVNGAEPLELKLTLKRKKGQLAEVVVSSSLRKETIASLYVRQKNSTAISDGITAEQIRATADNNAGQVLKRVSGVVVQNDKFITIRGVSDRYNNVLINGAMLPSTEPNRRNFSFDVVPSSLIDNIVINKTATPDMPSEFSGGFVQINTRDVPEKNFMDITIGTGFNTMTSGRLMKDHKRLPGDYLALKGDERKWYGDILDPRKYGEAYWKGDNEYMNKVGSQVANRWQYYNYAARPVQNYQLSGGLSKHWEDNSSLGFIGALTYRNEQLAETAEKNFLSNAAYQTTRYRFSTALGALANVTYKKGRHRISLKNIYNRRFNNQFDDDKGYSFDLSDYQVRTSSNLIISNVLQNRLEGEHLLGKLKADWYLDRNTMLREQPDTRFMLGYNKNNDGLYNYNFTEAFINWGAMYGSELKETRSNAGLNLALPFTVAGNAQQIKAGYSFSRRTADYNGSGFRVRDPRGGLWASKQEGQPYYMLTAQEHFAQGSLRYMPTFQLARSTGDGYSGDQDLEGAYLMGDFRFLQRFRLTGGLRHETSKVNIFTQYIIDTRLDSVYVGKVPTEKDWLPSGSLIYSITPKMNVRLAYGETMARPDFVERSPFIYYDFAEGLYVFGNYGIKTTYIHNYDFRYEYYPTGGEVFSFSLFSKEFSNPIERFFIQGNPSNSVEYNTIDKAYVKGLEVDFRKSMGFIAPQSRFLQKLFLSGNFSYMKGEVANWKEVEDTATGQMVSVKEVSERTIQGLAPYVINGGINYSGDKIGFNIAYNRFGRRVVYGGAEYYLVQYEQPRDVVDLQLSFMMMKKKLEVRLNASDILNQPFIIYSNSARDEFGGSGHGNDGPNGLKFDPDIDFINYKANKGSNYSFQLIYKL